MEVAGTTGCFGTRCVVGLRARWRGLRRKHIGTPRQTKCATMRAGDRRLALRERRFDQLGLRNFLPKKLYSTMRHNDGTTTAKYDFFADRPNS